MLYKYFLRELVDGSFWFGTRAEYIVLPVDYTFNDEYKNFVKSLCGFGVVLCMSTLEYYIFSF